MERQIVCVEKINEFIQEVPYRHIIVCCRSEEYDEGQVELDTLNGAVCISPLDEGRIQQYLSTQLGKPEIWQLIQQQPQLQALLKPTEDRSVGILQTPLFLTIFAAAYNPDMEIEAENQEGQLFKAYIEKRLSLDTRKLERKHLDRTWAYANQSKEPDNARTKLYLGWIATTLFAENEIDFLIEKQNPSHLNSISPNYWFIYFLLQVFPVFGFSWILAISARSVIVNMTFVLFLFSLFSLGCGLFSALLSFQKGIILVERLSLKLVWPFGDSFMPAYITLFGSTAYSMELARTYAVPFLINFVATLVIAVLLTLTLSRYKGKSSLGREERKKPNQGVIASVINILVVSVVAYPLSTLMLYLLSRILSAYNPAMISDSILFDSMFGGLLISVTIGLFLGGAWALIQYFSLRLILTFMAKRAPWNYARFLDYCVELRLLQRIGGRYRFIHRELLDHFAEL